MDSISEIDRKILTNLINWNNISTYILKFLQLEPWNIDLVIV